MTELHSEIQPVEEIDFAARAAEDERNRRTAEAMAANGQIVEEKNDAPVNYWGVNETFKFELAGGQYIEYVAMTEGRRRRFEQDTITTMSTNRGSDEMRMGINQGKQRGALIKHSVTGWNMLDPNGNPAPFDKGQWRFEKWLEQADPKIVDDLEEAIRKANAWLTAELDPDEILKEIDRLTKVREDILERRAGE